MAQQVCIVSVHMKVCIHVLGVFVRGRIRADHFSMVPSSRYLGWSGKTKGKGKNNKGDTETHQNIDII